MYSHVVSVVAAGVTAVFAAGVARAADMPSNPPQLVAAPVDKIFVPEGFDDNDVAEVILHGQFPNTCYKTGPAAASVDKASKTITIDAQSYRINNVLCADVLIKFIEPVKLGVLEKGTYQIVVKDNPRVPPTQLTVVGAKTSGQDDFLYAPVDIAAVDKAQNHDVLRLEGNYPYMLVGCMIATEIKTHLTAGNVLVVQPIAKLTEGGDCLAQRKDKRFKIEKNLGNQFGLVPGDYLIHVRTLNGNSFNRLVEERADQD